MDIVQFIDQEKKEYNIADYRNDTMVEYEVIDRNLEDSVDLGDLEWEYSNSLFSAEISNLQPPTSDSLKANLYVVDYEVIPYEDLTESDKVICVPSTEQKIYIKDTRYTDIASFTSAVDGKILWFQTTTQTEITR